MCRTKTLTIWSACVCRVTVEGFCFSVLNWTSIQVLKGGSLGAGLLCSHPNLHPHSHRGVPLQVSHSIASKLCESTLSRLSLVSWQCVSFRILVCDMSAWYVGLGFFQGCASISTYRWVPSWQFLPTVTGLWIARWRLDLNFRELSRDFGPVDTARSPALNHS